MKKLEKIFKALANKKRLEILKFLDKERRASVGEIAEEINTSLKSTSKHLLALYQADFLEKERVHGLTYYSPGDKLDDMEKALMRLLQKEF